MTCFNIPITAWLGHIAGIVIRSCIKQAMAHRVDPRRDLECVDWNLEPLPKKELRKIWTYITLEVYIHINYCCS